MFSKTIFLCGRVLQLLICWGIDAIANVSFAWETPIVGTPHWLLPQILERLQVSLEPGLAGRSEIYFPVLLYRLYRNRRWLSGGVLRR